MFHQHQWEDVSVDYTAPRGRVKAVERATEDLIDRLMFGVTNVTQRCVECRKLDTYTVTGKVSV